MKAIELAKLLEEKTPIEIIEQLEDEAQKEYELNDNWAKKSPKGSAMYKTCRFAASLALERAGAFGLVVSILKASERKSE